MSTVDPTSTSAGRTEGEACGRPGNQPLIPMDPLDVDQLPPEDLEDCARCGGAGEIVTGTDPESGRWITEECTACHGTGAWWWAA